MKDECRLGFGEASDDNLHTNLMDPANQQPQAAVILVSAGFRGDGIEVKPTGTMPFGCRQGRCEAFFTSTSQD